MGETDFQRRYDACLNLGMSEQDALYYANLSLMTENRHVISSETLAEVAALKAENEVLKARVAELKKTFTEFHADWCKEHCTPLSDGDHWEECQEMSAALKQGENNG